MQSPFTPILLNSSRDYEETKEEGTAYGAAGINTARKFRETIDKQLQGLRFGFELGLGQELELRLKKN